MARAVEIYREQGDRWQLGNAMALYAVTIRGEDPAAALAVLAETLRLGEETRLADHVLHAALGVARVAYEHGLDDVLVEVASVTIGPAERARSRMLEGEDWLGQLHRITVGRRRPATLDGIAGVAWRALGEVRAALDGRGGLG